MEPKEKVTTTWKNTLFLREKKSEETKGWLLDVMKCVEKLKLPAFTLDDIYKLEGELSVKHPNNKHVRDKIRQQLQTLRDVGYLAFIGRGRYQITNR